MYSLCSIESTLGVYIQQPQKVSSRTWVPILPCRVPVCNIRGSIRRYNQAMKADWKIEVFFFSLTTLYKLVEAYTLQSMSSTARVHLCLIFAHVVDRQ
jgi:hypothetical protein